MKQDLHYRVKVPEEFMCKPRLNVARSKQITRGYERKHEIKVDAEGFEVNWAYIKETSEEIYERAGCEG